MYQVRAFGKLGTGGDESKDCRFAREGGGVGTRSCTERLDSNEVPLARFRPLDAFRTSEVKSVLEPFAEGKMMVLLTTALLTFIRPSTGCRRRSGAVGSGESEGLDRIPDFSATPTSGDGESV